MVWLNRGDRELLPTGESISVKPEVDGKDTSQPTVWKASMRHAKKVRKYRLLGLTMRPDLVIRFINRGYTLSVSSVHLPKLFQRQIFDHQPLPQLLTRVWPSVNPAKKASIWRRLRKRINWIWARPVELAAAVYSPRRARKFLSEHQINDELENASLSVSTLPAQSTSLPNTRRKVLFTSCQITRARAKSFHKTTCNRC